MTTMREIQLTDPHRELKEVSKTLSETQRKLTDTELTLKHTKAQLDELVSSRDENTKKIEKAKRFASAQAARLEERTMQYNEKRNELQSAQYRLDFQAKTLTALQQKYEDVLKDKVEKMTQARLQALQELIDLEKRKNHTLILDRDRLDKFLEFQKQAHSPDLPLPLYLHQDEMRTQERSHSTELQGPHMTSLVQAFGRLENHSLF